MQLGSTTIVDTFAEAFRMRFARLIVSAIDDYWVEAATRELCGYGSSVIQCDAEIAVERWLAPDQSPDGRPAAVVLAFGFSKDALAKALPKRVGQCVMTCATTAVYDGLPATDGVEQDRIPLGKHIRFFGDGFQKSKKPGERRFWRIPVMDGEFLVEESLGVQKGVAGGNIILQGTSQAVALAAARRVVEAVAPLSEVITPFPGGVVRSGSKVGSRYKGMVASTNDAFCPTLRGRVESELVPQAQCAYEIVINGTSEQAVADAMRVALGAAAGEGIPAISAGNYGGKLGKFHYHLHQLLAD
ncbi:formylmethanofuran--tetrahydromethanopterin N-formyltransferase [Aeoliella sp. ICT_H6.2]|uniref:Formylmethanofuran--tetrahydromethanopterin formyltransferase n=1 Tax=Aeoliella straminimaris TaxID=2954799 RepID=A0A9X2JEY7_9BACT|nr:formylmethanofuran--tetrahydromethanopterin N-formyltransferase [Aeoliella straminimaris]MCO6043151.1 formylmethanofuran--tetrahydromethanopterin N-formyltransferase [Aeoliella straminimaris]